MKPYGLLINYEYCSGCSSCELACRNELGLTLEEWGIKLAQVGPVKMQGKWEWTYIPTPTHLCTMCVERIEAGQKPACAHHCLTQCIEAVPVEEISDKLTQYGERVLVFLP